jgi:hypothetical protein
MSEPDKRDDRSEGGAYGNLFKIIDMIVFELNRTKRMFIIMILSVMIIPPVSLFISSVIFVPPFEQGYGLGGPQRGHLGDGGQPPSPDGPHGPNNINEFFERFFSTRNIPLIISIVWLGIGIRQWIVLSKWTRRYEEYKRRRDEIDRQFDKSLSGSGPNE